MGRTPARSSPRSRSSAASPSSAPTAGRSGRASAPAWRRSWRASCRAPAVTGSPATARSSPAISSRPSSWPTPPTRALRRPPSAPPETGSASTGRRLPARPPSGRIAGQSILGRRPRMRVRRLAPAALALALAMLPGAEAKDATTRKAGPAAKEDRGIPPAPPRAEGEGPFGRLILRGVTLIDGTGAPPVGPVDIVVEGNRIADVVSVGSPGIAIDPADRPKAGPKDREMDLAGMYVLPGFIDMHGHIGGKEQGTPAEYVYKLWMGHGITTVRDPGSGNGLAWVLDEKGKSARNEITAPRLKAYVFFGQGRDEPFVTPEQARKWVDQIAAKGADGVKFFGYRPDIMQAAIDETRKKGLRSACHHAQMDVSRVNVLTSARWGLTSMEHWYGLPEALFDDRTIQDYPLGYNYADESHRFGEAGRLWEQAAPPSRQRGSEVMDG